MNRFYLISIAEILGVVLAIAPIIFKAIGGQDIYDVFFDKAFNTLYIALFARENNILIFYTIFIGLAVFMIFMLRKLKESTEVNSTKEEILRIISSILLGYILIELFLYSQMDLLFFRSAFISIPYYMGSTILFATLINLYTDKDLAQSLKKYSKDRGEIKLDPQFVYLTIRFLKILLLLFLSLNLILSNLGMAGYLSTPPELANNDYGGIERKYDVSRIKISYELPVEVKDYVGPINDSNEFYSYMYVPDLSGLSNVSLPVVFMLHGFGSWDLDLYYDEIMTLFASRGAIAIFTQYPRYVELTGPFAVDDNDTYGYDPYAYVVYTSMWKGIKDTINYMSNVEANEFTLLLGNNNFDLSNILVAGHSYGGGMAPYIAYKAIEEGWGSNQLIINQEAPVYTKFWEGMQTNFSVFPENTIVNVNTYSDDFVFPMCITLHEFALYENSNILDGNVIFSMIQSDLHGYPRLVATHYTPSDPTLDSLSYYGVFRRVDAMVAYLYALSNNNVVLRDEALPLFTTDAMLDMGVWSDGTPVNPMLRSSDAFELKNNFENLDEQSCTDVGL